MSPEIFASLRLAVEQISWLGQIGEDAVRVFELMLEKNLFVFGLTTGPATHWGSHRYEDKAHSMRSSLHAVIRVHRQLETQFKNNSNAPFIAETKRKYTESFNDNLEQKSLTAADAVEAGDVSESEEDQEDKEIPVEMRTIDVTAEQKAKHAQRLIMKRGRGKDKIVRVKYLVRKTRSTQCCD